MEPASQIQCEVQRRCEPRHGGRKLKQVLAARPTPSCPLSSCRGRLRNGFNPTFSLPSPRAFRRAFSWRWVLTRLHTAPHNLNPNGSLLRLRSGASTEHQGSSYYVATRDLSILSRDVPSQYTVVHVLHTNRDLESSRHCSGYLYHLRVTHPLLPCHLRIAYPDQLGERHDNDDGTVTARTITMTGSRESH